MKYSIHSIYSDFVPYIQSSFNIFRSSFHIFRVHSIYSEFHSIYSGFIPYIQDFIHYIQSSFHISQEFIPYISGFHSIYSEFIQYSQDFIPYIQSSFNIFRVHSIFSGFHSIQQSHDLYVNCPHHVLLQSKGFLVE